MDKKVTRFFFVIQSFEQTRNLDFETMWFVEMRYFGTILRFSEMKRMICTLLLRECSTVIYSFSWQPAGIATVVLNFIPFPDKPQKFQSTLETYPDGGK